MDLHLRGKVVLISGGAGLRGSIGQCTVQALVDEGAIPAILDIHDRGQEYVEEIREQGGDAFFVKTDLTEPGEVKAAIGEIIQAYGRIDVVINHVGLNDGVGLEASYEAFMDSLKLNLASFFLVVKHALPGLIASQGNILNIGSKVALTGQGGTSAYAAAKGGVLGLTREWAVDLLKHDIRVNALVIAESWTPAYDEWLQTLEHPEEVRQQIIRNIPLQQRMTQPQELAQTILFLISDRSSHTTGQFVHVDGGYVHLDRALLSENPKE